MSVNTLARVSRGCQVCRTRRVKCDLSRPSCKRCMKRNEVCEGYRDDSVLLFRSENEKAARRVHKRRNSIGSSPQSTTSGSSSSRKMSSSATSLSPPPRPQSVDDIPELLSKDISGLSITSPYPWAKNMPTTSIPSAEEQVVSQFFEKFVMYPCNNGSSPGFLEHLPSLFKDIQVEGRLALRWAVRAGAYASLSKESGNSDLGSKALQCYGLALNAMAEALRDTTRKPDDYLLMTVVVLDLFESLYLGDQASSGSHTGGMAGILRLRGPDQIYGTRGWSLFRLSHHRLQRQQLAFNQPPLPESDAWLDSLNDELPDVRIERNNHEISKTCEQARTLLSRINESDKSAEQLMAMIKQMYEVDQVSATWRIGPGWKFKTIKQAELLTSTSYSYPDFIQLHPDVWIAYEWNYHRTARVILHKHLLKILNRLELDPLAGEHDLASTISACKETSLAIIRTITDEVLSTVPQSLGDVDNEGRALDSSRGMAICKGIGGYFLLWPIKIIKGNPYSTSHQRSMAETVSERIRDCTGMRAALGEASIIE